MVSYIFYFHPYFGKIPILTNIFELGWNHQPDMFAENPSVQMYLTYGSSGWWVSPFTVGFTED